MTITYSHTARPFFNWLADSLGVSPDEIADTWNDGQSSDCFPPFERDSVLVAIEMLGPVDRVIFTGDEPWDRFPVTFRQIATSFETTMRCAEMCTYNIVLADNGVPVMVWAIDGNIDIDVIVTSPDVEAREQVLRRIRNLVEGPASTWRGQRILFDRRETSWFRHLAPARRSGISLDEDLQQELRRNLIVPIRHFGTDDRLADRRGVLLHGRPGTGKTWALEWVQAEVAEANDSATVIVTTPMMFGHGSPMKDLFDFAEEAAPVLIVMEDVDLAHLNRKMGPVGTDALGEMLQFMDGPARVRGAFVAATTNYPQVLDSALTKRPGRFDRKIEVGDAHAEARRQMAELLLERIGGSTESVDAIVSRTDGWSLAELDEAAHLAVLTSLDTGEPVDLLGALDQVHRGDKALGDKGEDQRGIGYV